MSFVRRPYAYTKMDTEDAEERNHQRAQFLIYKVMEQADSRRRRQSSLRVRICRLKIKIGKRFKKLKKTVLSSRFSVARVDVYKQLMSMLINWKRTVHGREAMATLPPIFN